LVCTQVLAIFLYLAIFFIAKSVDDDDYYNNTTIYTQAILDWDMPAWKEFSWSESGDCKEGSSYKNIVNEWLGTVEGNYTDSGVEPTDPRWKG